MSISHAWSTAANDNDNDNAGDGWTGTSRASKTCEAATWFGSGWASQAWLDRDRAKHTLTGRY